MALGTAADFRLYGGAGGGSLEAADDGRGQHSG